MAASTHLVPASPWLMAQTWDQLLFAHWPVSLDQLRRVVPPPLEVDSYGHQAWLAVVAFQITHMHLRGLPPAPGLSGFPEVNVRTYVRYQGRPGVLFLSLHCPNRLAMAVARPWFRLPYHYADVRLRDCGSAIDFSSHSPTGAAFVASYASDPEPLVAEPGSLQEWLTERYCYYAVAADRRVYRCDIHHAPWRLSQAQARISTNTLAQPFGIDLPQTAPLVHCGERADALVWPVRCVVAREIDGPPGQW